MYHRSLDIPGLIADKSIFLLGPRQTGKTTLVTNALPAARYFSLLDAATFRDLATHPEFLRQSLQPADQLVVIDEIQKLPMLLDEVQLMLDRNKALRFVLTGSSARKLKRDGANLLAGRVWQCALHPLTTAEVGTARIEDLLNRGGLPQILDSPRPQEELKAYIGTYLQEEIRAEALTRSIEVFSRFLNTAGLTSGHQINFTKVANDADLPPRTLREYYQLLEDTLLGLMLHPFRKTRGRKAVAASKFYLFDVGVGNHLMRREKVLPGSAEYGSALEHLVILELRAYLDYHRMDVPLGYWRSHAQHEVDAVVDDSHAIEVKAKSRITDADLKGVRALAEEIPLRRKIVVSLEQNERTTDDGIQILPVSRFFGGLWGNELVQL